jgi:hypothetical protein
MLTSLAIFFPWLSVGVIRPGILISGRNLSTSMRHRFLPGHGLRVLGRVDPGAGGIFGGWGGLLTKRSSFQLRRDPGCR